MSVTKTGELVSTIAFKVWVELYRKYDAHDIIAVANAVKKEAEEMSYVQGFESEIRHGDDNIERIARRMVSILYKLTGRT